MKLSSWFYQFTHRRRRRLRQSDPRCGLSVPAPVDEGATPKAQADASNVADGRCKIAKCFARSTGRARKRLSWRVRHATKAAVPANIWSFVFDLLSMHRSRSRRSGGQGAVSCWCCGFCNQTPWQRNLIKSSSIKRSSFDSLSIQFSSLFSIFLSLCSLPLSFWHSLINAFNVFNQATAKRLPKGQGGGVGAGLGSSNSVKHFTYLHINWLKRKYIQGNQAQSHPYRCTHIHTYVCMYVLLVHVCQRSKGRKGPFASPHFRSGLSL